MSLEQKIDALNQSVVENTIALRDLIAVLKRQAYVEAAQPADIPGFDSPELPPVGSASTGAVEQDPIPAPAAASKKGETKPKAEPKVEQPAPAAQVDYATAAAEVTKLSRAKGRDAAVALLARFGAAKLPEVAPERYAEVVDAVAAELTEQAA